MKQQAGIRFGQVSMSALTLGILSIFLLVSFQRVQGGCSRFGHSCFGAHGKRADSAISSEFGQAGLEPLGGGSFGPLVPRPAGEYYAGTGPRISPYLLEWLIAAHRAEARGSGPAESSSKDAAESDMRKK